MRRREFLGALGGVAAWPMRARAQQSERVQRVGIFFGIDEADPDAQARYVVFRQALQQLGWVEGRNFSKSVLCARPALEFSHGQDPHATWRGRSRIAIFGTWQGR